MQRPYARPSIGAPIALGWVVGVSAAFAYGETGDRIPSLLAQESPGPNPMMMLGMMGVMFVMAYFLMIRPQQRERQAREDRLKNLKKNDTVITAGGIVGTVVAFNPESKYVTLRIDEGTNAKIKLLKSAIVQVGDASIKNDDTAPAK